MTLNSYLNIHVITEFCSYHFYGMSRYRGKNHVDKTKKDKKMLPSN